MGWNQDGQLGDGTTTSTNTPQAIIATPYFGSPAVTAVAAGYYHSLFIRPGGSLWGMGGNSVGQLGDGTTINQHVPEQIVASNVVAVAAGYDSSLFIKSDGSLWAMGANLFGQLGDGTTMNQDVPEQIIPSNVVAVAAGWDHSLFIKSDGSLWGMGDTFGLGIGLSTVTNVPVQILAGNVVAAAAGQSYSLFIKSDGTLWAMGNNNLGQLGDPRIPFSLFPIQIVPLAPIANRGFEMGDFTAWRTNGNAAYTAVTTKSLYVHSGRFGAQVGPIGSLGYLSQNLFTAPGTNYLLSFWLNNPDGETPNEFRVSWNGTTLLDQTNLPATGWTNILLQAAATGTNTMLQFGFRNDNAYFGLDDVSLVPLVPPIITGITLAGPNLVLNAGNGQAGGTYFTLMSTNVALPLSQWSRVATNVLSLNGNFTISATNAVSPNASQQFYILQQQN
jgi:hypothetical protein